MNYPSIKFYKRNDVKRADLTQTIYLRLTIKRRYKYINTKVSVLEGNWNEKKNLVKRTDIGYQTKNKILSHFWKKANDIITNSILTDKTLTVSEFEKQFYGVQIKNTSFFDFMEMFLNSDALSAYKAGSVQIYVTQTSKIKKFRSEFNITDIDAVFIRSYESFMYSKLNNKKNTVNKSLSWLRTILNRAIDHGIIQENPFTKYKIKLQKEKGNRIALSLNDIDRLTNIFETFNLTQNQSYVLRYFLFCCYTGLRYSDLKALRFSDIKLLDNKEYIQIQMVKTGDPVTIPLSKKAKSLIIEKTINKARMFDVFTDQSTNRTLKDIMKIAGINKVISFHCSRHTFATVGFNRLKIPIEVISKILGHSDIKTTMIYTKIDNEKLREETLKWDTIN